MSPISPKLPPTDARSVLILPFHSITSVRDPSIYTSIIRQITARTTTQLLIYFHGSALLGHGEAQVTWFDVQRFLSIIYSASSQEAVKHDRVLMDVDVLIEGFAVDPTGRRDKGAHGMVGGKWDRVWVSENEEDGEEDRGKLAACLQHLPDTAHISTFPSRAIPGPPSSSSAAAAAAATSIISGVTDGEDGEQCETQPVVAVGGTFDHLHAGHKILLSMTVWLASRKIIVGVSDDKLLTNKSYRDLIEPIETRIARVRGFLHLLNPRLELQVVPINDVYGPTGYDPDIQALVVSKESVSGGDMIMKAREERSLPPLRQYIIDVITSSAPTREGSPSAAARVVGHGDHPPTLLENEEDASKLKTLKMGSTYIREWLFRQKESQPTR